MVCGMSQSHDSQENANADICLMGIPCPIFSVLNGRTKQPGYNPFNEWLFSTHRAQGDRDCKGLRLWESEFGLGALQLDSFVFVLGR